MPLAVSEILASFSKVSATSLILSGTKTPSVSLKSSLPTTWWTTSREMSAGEMFWLPQIVLLFLNCGDCHGWGG